MFPQYPGTVCCTCVTGHLTSDFYRTWRINYMRLLVISVSPQTHHSVQMFPQKSMRYPLRTDLRTNFYAKSHIITTWKGLLHVLFSRLRVTLWLHNLSAFSEERRREWGVRGSSVLCVILRLTRLRRCAPVDKACFHCHVLAFFGTMWHLDNSYLFNFIHSCKKVVLSCRHMKANVYTLLEVVN